MSDIKLTEDGYHCIIGEKVEYTEINAPPCAECGGKIVLDKCPLPDQAGVVLCIDCGHSFEVELGHT